MANVLRQVKKELNRVLGVDAKRKESRIDDAWNSLVIAKKFAGGPTEEEKFLLLCKEHFEPSHSQLFQDIFALYELGMKRGGYFVEFGATDGDMLSNTHLLEKQYGWTGILAEPARAWHERLHQNRGCVIETRCVTGKTGETVTFNETEWLELSTIEKWSSSDAHASSRSGGQRYEVETISLNDLLAQNDTPQGFDYLSVDTEGSELEILTAFDFAKYRPAVITVEHNHSPARQPLYDLITGNGYRRKFERFSMFDDWYVRA